MEIVIPVTTAHQLRGHKYDVVHKYNTGFKLRKLQN